MAPPLFVLATARHADEVRSLVGLAGGAARGLLTPLSRESIGSTFAPGHHVFSQPVSANDASPLRARVRRRCVDRCAAAMKRLAA